MKTLRYALTAALILSPALATAAQKTGKLADAKALEIVTRFVTEYTDTGATVVAAEGGWKAAAGANPGAALAGGKALAVGGLAELRGRRAEVVVAVARAAYAARNPDQTARLLGIAGGVGGMRITGEGIPFPEDAEAAQALFDEAMGAEVRGGLTFRKRTVSGTTFWGAERWIDHPNHEVKIRRTYWVSDYKGKTRAGTGAGTGLLARYIPRY